MSTVTIVPTGTANLASIIAGFTRLGARTALASDGDDVALAERVVLPGVGAFGATMGEVDRRGMRTALRDRFDEGRPTLAVCVGMQLLAATSEESDGVAGLGVVDAEVRQFPGTVRVPQLGWNVVKAGEGSRFTTDGWAYFANSYRVTTVPDGWIGATTNHGGDFVSALERGDVLACQFHPELSSTWGRSLLGRWLEKTGRRAS